MNRHLKLLEKILQGASDSNISFKGVCALLIYLGFEQRIKGSHHQFRKAGIPEIINLQEDMAKMKTYQVRQVRQIIVRYGLGKK